MLNLREDEIISLVSEKMEHVLNYDQMSLLKTALIEVLYQTENALDSNITIKSCEDVNEIFLEKFRSEMIVEKLAPGTINQYIRESRKFLQFIGKDFKDVKKDDIIMYLSIPSSSKNLSDNTLDNTRKYVSQFFSWLSQNDYINKSPFDKIKCTKRSSVKKEILSENEIELMKDACIGSRETAILDVLLSTGIRVSEIIGLKIDDIDFSTGKVIIYSKKTKTYRDGFLDARALLHTKQYLEDRKDIKSSYLFMNIKKDKHGKYNHMSESSVEKILKQLTERANIQKHVTVHTIRKTFASKLYRKGLQPMTISLLLGHKDFSTTAKFYIKINPNDLRNEYDRCMG